MNKAAKFLQPERCYTGHTHFLQVKPAQLRYQQMERF